jgi:hypothetical protein
MPLQDSFNVLLSESDLFDDPKVSKLNLFLELFSEGPEGIEEKISDMNDIPVLA